ncbi:MULTISPECIES: L-threonylcarbamoyladenylate synthase [Pseudanabaena]|jgi:tRNA threonylcarbamoyl adenosine modification protein (Sua5/YciO/YrdC/YwlC family)|uniref:L-threonylcarbamoyladenylate synthase n=1 Tax=Pseudanabaena TaxID=1152 RepID=UPI00247A5915|nr:MULTISPECIES: L-threonylcarbamoyladenylate synthase [Pseudanabaena]MEA5487456.1 L-threonylcarbamoyladenylate synthase [Pseudanabaena sp. CCNP1317]WGS73116.1 L-threonylcarbamoyladenylate synthase [Pseudanabaena galeata CCNP1313]
MATIHRLHPDNPQPRTIAQIVAALRDGAIMLYPTDTVYAIGCDLMSKSAVEKVRKLKQMSNDKPLTFLCSSLSNIAEYANVSNANYRTMKSLVPGPFTFILPATKLVPKLVLNPKRKTTGIRVPDHGVSQTIIEALGNPIISTSANLKEDDLDDEDFSHTKNGKQRNVCDLPKMELFDYFSKLVDLIVDDGSVHSYEVSTILDLTDDLNPQVLRQGLGEVRFL